MGQDFTPEQFVEALQNKQLDQAESNAGQFRGYTRNKDPLPGKIEFSVECLGWLHLPLAAIEKVVYLGQKECPSWVVGEAGHKHAYVEIYPKKPAEGAESEGYFKMLQAVLSRRP